MKHEFTFAWGYIDEQGYLSCTCGKVDKEYIKYNITLDEMNALYKQHISEPDKEIQ